MVLLALSGTGARAAEYVFKTPVNAAACVDEAHETYIVKITFRGTAAFAEAQNKMVDSTYAEVLFNKALASHLKAGDECVVECEGRLLSSRDYDRQKNAVFAFKLPKSSVSIKKRPPEQSTHKRPTVYQEREDFVKKLKLTGYFARYRADVIQLTNLHQKKLMDIIDNLDETNAEASKKEFASAAAEAAAGTDSALLKRKYDMDAKLMLSNVKELLCIAEKSSKNLKALNAIFEKQLKIAGAPISDNGAKIVIKLNREIDALKQSLIEIK